MIILGLTGGVGMGKSACAELLRGRSVPVVDTDDLARQVVAPGEAALAEIRSAFGEGVFEGDGGLNRGELARIVFLDADARKRLERILHPRIRQLWHAQADSWRSEGRPMCAVIIPLLFETGAEKELDATICVACSEATQYQRLAARGWSGDQILQRVRAQLPIEEKMLRSDFVIWTEGGMELNVEQLERIHGLVASS